MAFKPVDWITDNIFNSKNNERAAGRQVNSQNYNYGGSETGAEDQANAYTQQGDASQNRQATQAKVAVAAGAAAAEAPAGTPVDTPVANVHNIDSKVAEDSLERVHRLFKRILQHQGPSLQGAMSLDRDIGCGDDSQVGRCQRLITQVTHFNLMLVNV